MDVDQEDDRAESIADRETDTEAPSGRSAWAMDTIRHSPKKKVMVELRKRTKISNMQRDSKATNVPSTLPPVSNRFGTLRRPIKRPRVIFSPEISSEEEAPLPPNNEGTKANPIDVDLYVSPWEPTTVQEFVRLF
jgi:hypothetical protein